MYYIAFILLNRTLLTLIQYYRLLVLTGGTENYNEIKIISK